MATDNQNHKADEVNEEAAERWQVHLDDPEGEEDERDDEDDDEEDGEQIVLHAGEELEDVDPDELH